MVTKHFTFLILFKLPLDKNKQKNQGVLLASEEFHLTDHAMLSYKSYHCTIYSFVVLFFL